MKVPNIITDVTNRHTCVLPSGTIVRKERISDAVQVEFEYESSTKPVTMAKQPGSPRIKMRQFARSKRFPTAKSSRDWVSVPRELWNALGDVVDLAGPGSVAVHGIL